MSDEAPRQIQQEHQQLHIALKRIESSTEREGLARRVGELVLVLQQHFAREEAPGFLMAAAEAHGCDDRLAEILESVVEYRERVVLLAGRCGFRLHRCAAPSVSTSYPDSVTSTVCSHCADNL